jgi:hypothetical protein
VITYQTQTQTGALEDLSDVTGVTAIRAYLPLNSLGISRPTSATSLTEIFFTVIQISIKKIQHFEGSLPLEPMMLLKSLIFLTSFVFGVIKRYHKQTSIRKHSRVIDYVIQTIGHLLV